VRDVPSVDDLLGFLHRSPSPYHAVANAASRLAEAGFSPVDPADPWPEAGRHYLCRGGALVAWATDHQPAHAPFRIVGAHTDSPTLRVRPRPDTGAVGWRQIAVEVYGGALWNSWLDRDLGLSGRVVVDLDGTLTERLVLVDRPLARVPQLAIHLDRDVNGKGLTLNPQQHLTPVWGTGPWAEGDLADFVAGELGVDPAAVRSWDLLFHDLTPPALLGRDRELLASARLDNLLSCWAGIEAITAVADRLDPGPDQAGSVPVLCLFDHEEVGSTSATGADGALLAHVLERLVLARGGGREDLLRALAGSCCASVDMAHATHPNYPERHEPGHLVRIDGGPVVKCNVNQRYATDAPGQAALVQACEAAGVPHQLFSSRNDQPCGSTIGPVTAARLGITTADIGVAQLSMHSARELCGAHDPARLAAALTAFVGG
jgi:aspartyl aminopeptidase